MNVEILKKIENRHSYCLRAVIYVSRLLNFMSASKELITTSSPSHNVETRSGVAVLATFRIKFC